MIVLLIVGVALIIAALILLALHVPGVAIAAFLVGIALILIALIRRSRRGRRVTPGDVAVISSINSGSGS